MSAGRNYVITEGKVCGRHLGGGKRTGSGSGRRHNEVTTAPEDAKGELRRQQWEGGGSGKEERVTGEA
ncbi:hypothetical protein FKM82_022611 [Ascaphus truei]